MSTYNADKTANPPAVVLTPKEEKNVTHVVQQGPRGMTLRIRRAPVTFSLFTVAAMIIFIVARRDGTATFRLSLPADSIQLPVMGLPVFLSGIVVTFLLLVLTAGSIFTARTGRTPGWMVGSFSTIFFVGFLIWAAAGQTLTLPGLLVGALSLSMPLIFGSLAGVISERAGIINVAIEGQLLAGAFVSAVIASVTGSAYAGLVAAIAAGALVSFVLAAFSIKYLVDQVIVGVVLNVLVIGLTNFLYTQVLTTDTQRLNTPPRFEPIDIPLLSEIPVIGPLIFRQTLIVYLAYIAVACTWFALFRTKWGLHLRAAGEHPNAAESVGINVLRLRFRNVSLAGAIAGLGGAYFTLGSVGAFNKEMTAGAGFIAIAAVIFGRWNPLMASCAALLFGLVSNLQNLLGIIGSPVPSEFLLMLPYLVTIVAVAGAVGHVRGPAAAGSPYKSS